MRVQFDATLDDLVDVSLRALRRSKAVRSWRRVDYLSGVFLAAILAGLPLFLLLPEPPDTRLIFGLLAALTAACLYPLVYNSVVKRQLRGFYREQVGGNCPFVVEVELSRAGVIAHQNGCTIGFDWTQVELIQETADSIDFYARQSGIVVVRKRAFDSTSSMLQFIDEARRYFDEVPHASRSQ